MPETEYVDWGGVAPARDGFKGTDEKNVEYLWLKSGNTYKIRPIHLPVLFYKYFHRFQGKLRVAICGDPATCTVIVAHPDLEKSKERYAVFVIDRADGRIKVMEGPRSVFLPMRKRKEATGKEPGGKEGGDWQIEITGSGLRTEYSVTYLEDTPFESEEKSKIKKVLSGDKQRLKRIFEVDSDEEIEKKLFGEIEDKSSFNTVADTEVDNNIDNTDNTDDDDDDDFDF